MTDEQFKMLNDIENYNVLAKTMASTINAERTDVIVFALKKQNDLLTEFMDSVGFELKSLNKGES